MKNSIRIFAVLFMLAAFSAPSFAQYSASADATATIISPIFINKNTDMNFGNVAIGAIDGTVILDAFGGRTATGGVTLPASAGVVSAATFDVFGEDGYTYSITLPSSITLTRVSGTESMTADNFTSAPSGTGTLLAGYELLQ